MSLSLSITFLDLVFVFLNMMKLFRVQLSMLVFISLLGGVVIYEIFGSLSGLDAIAITGVIAGIFIGIFSGKNFGMFAIFPSLLSATCASFFFGVIALFSLNYGDSLLLVLGQCAMGFSLLAGTVIGCQWGGHLFIRDQDLAQLREVFGDNRGFKKAQEKHDAMNEKLPLQ